MFEFAIMRGNGGGCKGGNEIGAREIGKGSDSNHILISLEFDTCISANILR